MLEPHTNGLPEDLRRMRERAEALGIRVRIPESGRPPKPPAPFKIKGKPLSEIIVEQRHGGE